ncbi:hypothetical protein QJS64_19450 (plasmid) [Paraclostridium bifermentans]|uniref:Uncharacterized protein n=1 Tax=Paraclostridium bifermentans TaxID=1490 RepID=A0ABY8R9M8_PARBF|nr:hypothetical protein QJS64_19450 [Paraclostridium bifermentans]
MANGMQITVKVLPALAVMESSARFAIISNVQKVNAAFLAFEVGSDDGDDCVFDDLFHGKSPLFGVWLLCPISMTGRLAKRAIQKPSASRSRLGQRLES